MAESVTIAYRPAGETLRRFHNSGAFMRVVIGPLGSGKTTACAMEVWRRMQEQAPDGEGVRRSRWLGVRSTYPQLETTTIPEWRGLFDDRFGRFSLSKPPTHRIRAMLDDGTRVEAEMIFMALDEPDGADKLRGMQLTGIWFNELREIPRSVVAMGLGRTGRFPPRRQGGATWFGAIADTNPCDQDHWLYDVAELRRPKGWDVLRQPGGVIRRGERWVENPGAENLVNLPAGYYGNQIAGAGEEWIRVFLAGDYGFVVDGKPVFPEYADNVHCRPADPTPGVPVLVGLDFGLSPAALFAQRKPDGALVWFDELVADEIGAVRFAAALKAKIAADWPELSIAFVGDPAGEQRAQTDERTVFEILRGQGLAVRAAPSNAFALRREAVAGPLTRLVDGRPGFAVDPRCRTARRALMGGYCFRRLQAAGRARFHDTPEKNGFSHVADAGQYANLGLGEGLRSLGRGASPRGLRRARGEWDVFDLA